MVFEAIIENLDIFGFGIGRMDNGVGHGALNNEFLFAYKLINENNLHILTSNATVIFIRYLLKRIKQNHEKRQPTILHLFNRKCFCEGVARLSFTTSKPLLCVYYQTLFALVRSVA